MSSFESLPYVFMSTNCMLFMLSQSLYLNDSTRKYFRSSSLHTEQSAHDDTDEQEEAVGERTGTMAHTGNYFICIRKIVGMNR